MSERARLGAIAALCCAAGAIASLILGQDANWDLLNYHLYNPWAFLGGHWSTDHHPSGVQNYFNPALDLLVYPLLTTVPDWVGGALLGAFQGLAFFALFVIAREAFGGGARALPMALLATVAGATSAMTIAEIGTTFGDLTTAVAVLAAIAIAQRAYTRPDEGLLARRMAAAGALLGVATGLKLTNAVFALAMAGAIAGIAPGRRWRSLAWFLVPAGLGLAAIHGPWSALLAWKLGNPIFPFANRWFESPHYWISNFTAYEYFPESWYEAVLFPLLAALDNRTTELPFRDFRLAAAYLAVLLLGALLLVRARLRTASEATVPATRPSAFLLTFLAIAYFAWLETFSIQRYIVALEMLAPLACLLLIAFHLSGTARLVAGTVLVALFLVTTKAPDWGRRGWEGGAYSRLYNFQAPPPGSAVIISTVPLAFLAPTSDAPGVSWIGPRFTERDRDDLERKIAGRKLFIVTFGDGRVLKHNLSRLWRLRLNPDGPCTESWSRLAGSIVLCPVTRGPGTDVASLVNDSRGWSFEFATAVKSIELERGKAAWVDYRITHTGKGPALAALGETRHVAGLPRNANRNDEVALSYHLTREDGAMVVFEGLRTPLPRSLAPGESYDLQLRVAAPSQPGTYRLVPDVVHEGVAWMNERAKGDAIVLTVR